MFFTQDSLPCLEYQHNTFHVGLHNCDFAAVRTHGYGDVQAEVLDFIVIRSLTTANMPYPPHAVEVPSDATTPLNVFEGIGVPIIPFSQLVAEREDHWQYDCVQVVHRIGSV
jgi:hypothetical protein